MTIARIHRLPLGSLDALVLHDGIIFAPAAFLFANASPHELAKSLARHGLDPGARGCPQSGQPGYAARPATRLKVDAFAIVKGVDRGPGT
jgi:hypothetical protein